MECEECSCEIWSVESEDSASSLTKKNRLSREGHGRERLFLNYISFIFGKLPPPSMLVIEVVAIVMVVVVVVVVVVVMVVVVVEVVAIVVALAV